MGVPNLDNHAIRDLLKILPMGVCITTDVSCHEIHHNPAASQFFRFSADQTLSNLSDSMAAFRVFRRDQEIFPHDMPLQRAAGFGESSSGDVLEFVWEDGSRKTSRWNSNPIYGETGVITGAIAIFEDITARRQACNKFKTYRKNLGKLVKNHAMQIGTVSQMLQPGKGSYSNSEMFLSLAEVEVSNIFRFSPDSISIISLQEGRFMKINDAFMRLTGYEGDEVLGHDVEELQTWAFPQEKVMMLKQLQTQGIITNFEMHLRIKSGRVLICLLSAGIVDINGAKHIICVIKDISEQKYLEEKLRASEERFSKAFKSSPYPMCISTLQEGRIIEVNESFCKASGYNLDEIIGRSSLEVGLWVNPKERRQVQTMVANKGAVRDLEFSFCTKLGEHRTMLFSADRLNIQDTPCLFAVFTDITEKRRIEAEMLRLDRLNVVGEMAVSIGHEIRNPMTTVRGYLQILRENGKYIAEAECFDIMIEELDRANQIITEFLSLAKNKLVELQPGNLNSVIVKILPLLQTSALVRDHNLIAELSDVPDVLMDKKEIRKLIINLVQNGLESMSWSGRVTIRTCVDKGKIVLQIQDQGHGIEGQFMDKLGTPFFTTKENGTGLGLAIVYRIAAHHNAKIEIESGSAGTTFYIIFPMMPSLSAAKISARR